MDFQYSLPPFQQILFTPTIIISVFFLGLAIVVMVYLSRRAKVRAKIEASLDALRMVEKILYKRGGSQEDVNRMLMIFKNNPGVDPAIMIMIRERFQDELCPLLIQAYGEKFGQRMDAIYFPPPKESQRVTASPEMAIASLIQETKPFSSRNSSDSILTLMDSILKPGVITKITFGNIEGSLECMVMGHDMRSMNVTLPANRSYLVSSIQLGMPIEGIIESGLVLFAYTATVIQAVGGNMPYCKISSWKSVWEVRTRESIRLPIFLDIDFRHISTVSSDSIRITSLDEEFGALRPGKLMDISLGGCGIETQSSAKFNIGDMIRFSHVLADGTPAASLLGAVVKSIVLDPQQHGGAKQCLHVQFLIIDDVSQRILVRVIRQLQDSVERDEWIRTQQLMQNMRRNRINIIGSPTPVGRPGITRTNGGTSSTSKATRSGSTRMVRKPPSSRI